MGRARPIPELLNGVGKRILRTHRQSRTMAERTSTQHIHGYCAFCAARCGTVATVEDGRFTRLDPDPTHPTGRSICAKGRAAPEIVYHPERLTYPLRRTRPKGEPDPGWERITWDEALNMTAAAMREAAERYGPHTVAHGWWQRCAELDAPGYDPFGPMGANFNLLVGTAALDPVSGTASHRSSLCQVRRAEPVCRPGAEP
jgi:hypothetical protein